MSREHRLRRRRGHRAHAPRREPVGGARARCATAVDAGQRPPRRRPASRSIRSTTAPSWWARRCTPSATTCSRAALLVTLVLFAFLLDLRAALIVAVLIPLSLLVSFIYLQLRGMWANLLSMGAVDFGIIVDGGVVIIESILVGARQRRPGATRHGRAGIERIEIRPATQSVVRPTVFALLIIIAAYLPIFMLQRVEGRIFAPMANTVVAALVGALLFSVILVPVLASLVYRTAAASPRVAAAALGVARLRADAAPGRCDHPWLTLAGAALRSSPGRRARPAPRLRVPARAQRGRALRRPSPCRRTSRFGGPHAGAAADEHLPRAARRPRRCCRSSAGPRTAPTRR